LKAEGRQGQKKEIYIFFSPLERGTGGGKTVIMP